MEESLFRYLTYLTEEGVPGFQTRAFGPGKGDDDRGRICHIFLHTTSHLRLSCHVWFGFGRHPCTVSGISLLSYMRWKGDDDPVILVLIRTPVGLWIILCDHDKVLHHLLLG
jgi:hypothetical protein